MTLPGEARDSDMQSPVFKLNRRGVIGKTLTGDPSPRCENNSFTDQLRSFNVVEEARQCAKDVEHGYYLKRHDDYLLSYNFSMIKLPKLVLASGSPRRSEIMNSVGWEFTKDVPDIDETELPGEKPDVYVQRLAKEKARAIAPTHPGEMVLAADTTVVIGDQIIGKPVDLADARRMLEMLSGNWHEVLTGIAVTTEDDVRVGLQRTRVKFAKMADDEINFLVQKGDPLDKAGAYAVQAQAALFIEGIEGDYWNVVGLPVSLVYEMVAGLRK
jgi:septum formation protein